MDGIEEIKQRKLLELQQKQVHNQINQNQKIRAQIDALENIARKVLTKDALSRYGNIKAAHPELAMKILVVIAQIVQQTNVNQLTDDQFKEVLQHILPEKRETKITYKCNKMARYKHLNRKLRLIKRGHQTRWAPFWTVLKMYGKTRRVHPGRHTVVKRSWRRTKTKA